MSSLPLNALRRCEFLTLNGAWLFYRVRYRDIFNRLEDGLTRWWSNRITCLHMGPLWIRNLFTNLAAAGPSWTPWPDWGSDPIFVCGAGVTLEEALPWIQKHRNQIRLLAADTALPILRDWNLVPDGVVCLEAQHANLRDFAGWTGAPVQLFTDLTSFPPGSRIFSRAPCWFITEFTELSLWSRWPWSQSTIPRIPPLGSVGVAAAWIAWKLSKGPVILAGLDFSFPHGRTHARGAPSLSAMASRSDRLHPMEQTGTWRTEGIRKDTATGWLTTPVMQGYAWVLSDQARSNALRTATWSDQGLVMDLPVWNRCIPGKKLQPATVQNLVTYEEDPREWLQTEKTRWKQLLESFERLNRDPGSQEKLSHLKSDLLEVDYLTFSFPDPELRLESDWLIRAQRQIRWILERVETLSRRHSS